MDFQENFKASSLHSCNAMCLGVLILSKLQLLSNNLGSKTIYISNFHVTDIEISCRTSTEQRELLKS